MSSDLALPQSRHSSVGGELERVQLGVAQRELQANHAAGETTAERVKDPDAVSGGAVRGKPDRPPGGMANTYSYPRIPGKYLATFHLKVVDNTIDKPVFRVGVADCVMHPLPGVPAISNPTLDIKATDFKKPNDYQDFTITFEHSGFKLDWQPLFTQDVLVLANVETRGLGLGQVRMIDEFVRQGGGLMILGGLTTLGQSDNMQRGWGEFLPIEQNGPWEIRKCEPVVEFARPANNSPLAGVKWDKPPTVFYRHVVKAKPGATVLLAGDHGEPLLVGTTCGKGRVVVFTGAVLGQPAEGEAPFWDSQAWKAVMSHAVTWAAGK